MTLFPIRLGGHIHNSLYKYYFMDLGVRNARIKFRQSEKSLLMENIIYNELRVHGFNVDVDFICNLGGKRHYIQPAYRMEPDEKIKQERKQTIQNLVRDKKW